MRLGIDLGGTKTEILALGPDGREILRRRQPTPRDYDGLIAGLAALVAQAGDMPGVPLGVAIPGCESGGRIKNANTTYLNGRPLRADLEAALGRPVRLANDANCFALSEATDGAGAGAGVVFGVILGTGVGGGIVADGKLLGGAHGVGGEWGHIPLPDPTAEEWAQGPACYCGRHGCMETWCSGPGLCADHMRATGETLNVQEIAACRTEDTLASMTRYIDRLARGLAAVVNILDPDVIVLGGGLSNIARLYDDLPPLVETYAFTLGARPRIVQNRHGDSSGVRGAAWLWPETPA